MTKNTPENYRRFKYIFYNFHSYLVDELPGVTNITHKVNYAVAMTYCSDCGDHFCPSFGQVLHYLSGLDGRDNVDIYVHEQQVIQRHVSRWKKY